LRVDIDIESDIRAITPKSTTTCDCVFDALLPPVAQLPEVPLMLDDAGLAVVIGLQDLVNFFGENLSILIAYHHKVMILLDQSI
jgi:hypothetical protein